MKPLSITWVTLVGFVCAPPGFLGFFIHMRAGDTPMIVTSGPAVVFAVMTALPIWSGPAVRRLCANKDTWVDVTGMTRVIVFAETSAIVGSAFVGVLIGVMIVPLMRLEASAVVANATASSLSGLVGFAWIVVAFVVER